MYHYSQMIWFIYTRSASEYKYITYSMAQEVNEQQQSLIQAAQIYHIACFVWLQLSMCLHELSQYNTHGFLSWIAGQFVSISVSRAD